MYLITCEQLPSPLSSPPYHIFSLVAAALQKAAADRSYHTTPYCLYIQYSHCIKSYPTMADNNVRQRRGKKSTSAAIDSEVSSTTNNNDTKPTPSEQLKNAQARLIVSRDRTADLHTAWR